MFVQFLIFTAGLVVLYVGAEGLIRGATSLALKYGIRPLVVGITVVALGTSMPEFVVNFFASLKGQDGLALGNVVGSNICNIALILGMSSLVLPLAVAPGTLKKEYPLMMAVMVLFFIVALDGVISRVDGLILVAGLVAFLVYLVVDARRHAKNNGIPKVVRAEEKGRKKDQYNVPIKLLFVVGGTILLALGADLMVRSATEVATIIGIDPKIVGLSVVAIGTSLPELAASIVSAIKKEADISVGNVLGSNMLNILFVIGFIALIRPLEVDAETITIYLPIMLAFGLLLLPIAWTKYSISRFEGGIFLASFTGYIFYLTYTTF